MECVNCGVELPENCKFCIECGAKQPETKVCPKCNSSLPLNIKFCSNCGYDFSGETSRTSSGFSMGDKNVIAGDVVGHSEDIQVAGNATIVRNEDETKKVLKCSVCGKHVTTLEIHTCPNCGESVCNDCFNKTLGMCITCQENSSVSKENEYKETLRKVLADGIVDLQERKTLEALQAKLGLSDIRAQELENEMRYDSSNSETFTTLEKITLDDATKLFYDENNVSKAYELIKPLYFKHQYNEELLNLYLPILAEVDSEKAISIINNLKADILTSYLVKIDIYINSNLSEAEKIINIADQLWPNNFALKCSRAVWSYKLYEQTKRSSFYDDFYVITEQLREPSSKYEARWLQKCNDIKAFIEAEKIRKANEAEEERQKELQLAEEKRIAEEERKAEEERQRKLAEEKLQAEAIRKANNPILAPDGSGDYPSIKDALECVNEGATITLKSGCYHECLDITKKVIITGNKDNMPVISLDSGTVCKINSDVTFENIWFRNDNPIAKDYSSMDLSTFMVSDYLVEIYSDCTLDNCKISNSFDNGCLISGENIKPKIITTDFCDNLAGGLTIKDGAKPVIEYSNFYTNAKEGANSDRAYPIFNECGFIRNEADGFISSETGGGEFNGCLFGKNKGHGAFAWVNSEPIYYDCKFQENSSCGFEVMEANPVLKKCEFFENEDSGVILYEKSTGTFEDCILRNNARFGFSVTDESNPTITNCEIFENNSCGIALFESAKANINTSKIHNNKSHGIQLSNSSNPTVSGCEIVNNAENGIGTWNTASGSFTSCDVSSNGGNGFAIIEASCPTIESCRISNNANDGVFVVEKYSGTSSIKKCTIFGNAGKDIRKPLFSKVTLSGNSSKS